jgi:hypothetical protein
MVKKGDVTTLPDATFAPWIEWSLPTQGAKVSIHENPKVSWAPYPAVRKIKIHLQRIDRLSDGFINISGLGETEIEAPTDHAILLSELLKMCKPCPRAGETLEIDLKGFGEDGKLLTQSDGRRRMILAD